MFVQRGVKGNYSAYCRLFVLLNTRSPCVPGRLSYLSNFAAALLTAASLTFPVLSLMVPSVAFGEN
jgi:hypothetical protein